MKRISLVIVVALTLALLAYAHGRTPKAKGESDGEAPTYAQAASSPDRTVATQDRINRYFHREVIPKLRDCWRGVQGEGMIEMKFTYARAGGGWTSERVERSGSTLPGGQDAVALRCMQEAVRGTSLPAEEGVTAGGVGGASKFVINWNWPVPLPANSAEFAAKRAGGGKTGGCDGFGTPAKCYTCGQNFKCIKVCVGVESSDCQGGVGVCIEDGDRECASGGPWGVSGGVIMY